MLYVATVIKYKCVVHWKLFIEGFGPNIHHIGGVKNIVAGTLSRFPSTSINKYEPCTRKSQCCANKLFTIGRVENNEYCFPLNLLIVQREQQK